ncbi:MAG: hypothetical protein WBX38_21235 [Candidatus Sulfotelmatobacter sp.]
MISRKDFPQKSSIVLDGDSIISILSNRPVLMLRRLEDRICELCAKTVSASDEDLASIISQLKSALREHTERLRELAGVKLASSRKELPPERRSGLKLGI